MFDIPFKREQNGIGGSNNNKSQVSPARVVQ